MVGGRWSFVLETMAGIVFNEIIFAQQHDLGFAHVAGLLDETTEKLVADALFLEFRQYGQGENDNVQAVRVVPDELLEFFV